MKKEKIEMSYSTVDCGGMEMTKTELAIAVNSNSYLIWKKLYC
jgi:hypothetical protein